MERLTKRHGTSVILPIERSERNPQVVENVYKKALQKLAAYEDTGMEPIEVKGLRNSHAQLQETYMKMHDTLMKMGRDLEKHQKALDKLVAYEDTGLEPEEIRELLNDTTGPLHEKLGKWIVAEREGKLVVLPCKVGDTVYLHSNEKVYQFMVTDFEINKYEVDFTAAYCGEEEGLKHWRIRYPISKIGKSVYFTKEEAEAALEKMKGDQNGSNDL